MTFVLFLQCLFVVGNTCKIISTLLKDERDAEMGAFVWVSPPSHTSHEKQDTDVFTGGHSQSSFPLWLVDQTFCPEAGLGEAAAELWAPSIWPLHIPFWVSPPQLAKCLLPFKLGYSYVISHSFKSFVAWSLCCESHRHLILMCKTACLHKNILISLIFDIQGHCFCYKSKKQEKRKMMPKSNTITTISEFLPTIF